MRRAIAILILAVLVLGCAGSSTNPPENTPTPTKTRGPAKDIYASFNGEEYLAMSDKNGDGEYDYREKRYDREEIKNHVSDREYQQLVDEYGAVEVVRYVRTDTDGDGEMDTVRIYVNGDLHLEEEYDPLVTIWDRLRG